MNLHERLARLIDRAVSRGWPIEKLRWLMELAINRDLKETARRSHRPFDWYVTAKASELRRLLARALLLGFLLGIGCFAVLNR